MRFLLRALRAEVLKIRRTPALWMVPLIPTLLAVMNFCLYLRIRYLPEGAVSGAGDTNPWLYYTSSTFTLWIPFAMTYLGVLVAAFVCSLEHQNDQWRKLFALAIPRSTIYFAKLLVLIGLTLVACVILFVENLGFAWAAKLICSECHLGLPVPCWELFKPLLVGFVLGWPLLAAQLWISARIKNLALILGAGFAAVVGGSGAGVSVKSLWVRLIPWALPSQFPRALNDDMVSLGLFSLGMTAVLAIVGCWDTIRRDVLD